VGYWFAHKCHEQGMKIVALSNKFGGVYNKKGIDIHKAKKTLEENDERSWGDIGDAVTNEELLTLDVDILVPAAIEKVITIHNVNQIKAKIILELANGPTVNVADNILFDNGIFVVPDILANAGGVIVSYFEWLQNRTAEDWHVDDVRKNLQDKMKYAVDRAMERKSKYNIPLRVATYALALKRLADANESLGTKGYFQS
jgi:glutamate dehydrogenase (NAD(P)+)